MTLSKVDRGQVTEDRFTGTIEQQTSKVPSSTFLGLAVASGCVCHSETGGQRQLGAVRRAVGRSVPDNGQLQQNGKTARVRRE
jgi:hypothetical protein